MNKALRINIKLSKYIQFGLPHDKLKKLLYERGLRDKQ